VDRETEGDIMNAKTVEAASDKRALVIGGGIAGIQAALDLADARIPVTLVEKSPTLGGRMAQLDKTFPTMDCAI
jgi:heterodisulfide reductase subunit A